uniref:Transmembrane protein n=1 Tax=Rhizophora mucronata TaxID=61149 RepID=A0A2P2MZK7_RHIMU
MYSMVSSALAYSLCSVWPHNYPSPNLCRNQTSTLAIPRFLSFNPSPKLPILQFKKRTARNSRPIPTVSAAQSNIFRVIQTVWNVGKDVIEAGTNVVPDSVPRPVARISVTIVALAISLLVLKSFLSTAFFVLATMGLVYFLFIAFNKDQEPRGGGGTNSSDDPVEEARRIMDKYK